MPLPHIADELLCESEPFAEEHAIAKMAIGTNLASLNLRAMCERSYARVPEAAPVISQETQSSRYRKNEPGGSRYGHWSDDIDLQPWPFPTVIRS